MKTELIASCEICKNYYREKMKCPGCGIGDENKSKSYRESVIINYCLS